MKGFGHDDGFLIRFLPTTDVARFRTDIMAGDFVTVETEAMDSLLIWLHLLSGLQEDTKVRNLNQRIVYISNAGSFLHHKENDFCDPVGGGRSQHQHQLLRMVEKNLEFREK